MSSLSGGETEFSSVSRSDSLESNRVISIGGTAASKGSQQMGVSLAQPEEGKYKILSAF